MREKRLSEIGEKKLVEMLVDLLRSDWRCNDLPPGDDAACVSLPGGAKLLVKIDGFSVSSVKLPWMTLYDVGWKAVVATASDLVAKGGRPLVFLVSIGLRRDDRAADALELVKGARDAAKAVGAWLAGGDTNAAGDPWIDTAGVATPVRIVAPRVRNGDLIYTTVGRYGLTGLAFHIMRRGDTSEIYSYPEALRATTRPLPRLEFLSLLEEVGECITWAGDVSDGLCATLRNLHTISEHRIILDALPPLHPEAIEYAESHRLDISELILYGGEEYEIVFTVARGCETHVERAANRLGLRIARIGFVVPKSITSSIHTERVSESSWIPINSCLERVSTGWDQFKGWA
ncbi:AIR synthase related protein [Pyrolobus fumarii 1A]|uniref:Thiamine-monophosphate kinase n=1 Tax=Pyrolobus fumarii (strain DSM 11204 / 1A) TaxID=694429 RepID=G0ED44_PYRF1|nr:thiamine-phosphate kinase [Pyrolobus fumarii]AEM39722.1 AIR synthase related protein [Pyrolobus fumarii 1A]